MDVQWHAVKGFDGFYEINEIGELRSISRTIQTKTGIYSFRKGRDLTTRINNYGYVSARLSRDGRTKTIFLHRLIAEIFIPNPDNKPFINHKNGVKTDNRIDNLEWVSHRENVLHAYRTGLNKKIGHTTNVINIETGKIYKSIKEASDAAGIVYSTFKNLLNGNRFNKTPFSVLNKAIA